MSLAPSTDTLTSRWLIPQVICSPTIEFIHGGLDKQVTHHLFPRLPRHNLRAAGELVRTFCKEQELEFAEYRFVEGNMQVLGVVRLSFSRVPVVRPSSFVLPADDRRPHPRASPPGPFFLAAQGCGQPSPVHRQSRRSRDQRRAVAGELKQTTPPPPPFFPSRHLPLNRPSPRQRNPV